jgi:DeoR/GlpR family transcriptional regulator of sugar metabolism
LLKEERYNTIITKLRQDNRVSSTELSEQLQVSDDTIRRDLHELASRGVLQKVHGGAIPKPTTPEGFDQRMDFSSESKKDLCRKSLNLIEKGMMLMIDGGTTNLTLVNHLPALMPLEIVTNSLPLAEYLSKFDNIKLHVLGGAYDPISKVFKGQDTIRQIGNFNPELCVVGACSIHHRQGLTTPYEEENFVKQEMIEASQKTLVLATNDKVETAVRYRVCGFDAIDYLALEDTLEPSLRALYTSKHPALL